MIGKNGGLIGVRRVPSTSLASGIWSQNEQVLAKRAGIWPLAYDANGDPYFSNVSLLLHMDGSNGSTIFTDSSLNALSIATANGALISTAQSKFGGASGSFVLTSNEYINTPSSSLFNFSGVAFTVECWVRINTGGGGGIFSQRIAAVYAPFEVRQSGTWVEWLIGDSSVTSWAVGAQSSSGVITANTWHHFALVGDGTNLNLYVDGVSRLSTSQPTWVSADRTMYFGSGGDSGFNGYIDEIRITKGVARYTSNFTPPTAPFPEPEPETDPSFSNVSLLLHMDGSNNSTTFTDSSSNPHTVTRSGDAKISTAQSKYGGASGYFDGSSDFLSVSTSAALQLSNDFTIEAWVYPLGTADYIIGSSSIDSNTQIFRLNQGTSGGLSFYLNGTQVFNPTAAGITANAWQHLAISRSGSSTRMFVNGIQIGSTNTSWTGTFSMNVIGTFFLNGSQYVSPSYDFNGYIDDLRITKGVARYTANFTPPTAPFPNQGGSVVPETPVFNVSAITYIQSSMYSGTTPVSNQIMTDGSFSNTGAATNSGAGQFIQMDLGGNFSVDRIIIGTATSSIPGGWSKAYTENKTIQHSLNGTAWTNTFNTGTFAADGIYTFNVNIQARYIRIIDGANSWIAISEFYALTPNSDPSFSNVSLLVSMDGSNGSTTFTDLSSNNHALTVHGNAQVTTTDPKYGSGALLLDGTGDYLRTPADADFALGTGDFTVECWCYPTVINDNDGLFTFGSQFSGLCLALYQGYWLLSTTGSGGTNMGLANADLNTWRHVAVTRSGTSLQLYIDGVQKGSTVFNSTNLTDNQLKIGYYYDPAYGFVGKVDEFRVTKGVARYTANFTPPTSPFPNS